MRSLAAPQRFVPRAATLSMALHMLLLLLLPQLCLALHMLPGLGRSQLSARCRAGCTFDTTSELATEPKHFIHSVINETGSLRLVSLPRKEATLYLTKVCLQAGGQCRGSADTLFLQAAIESCVPGAVVETGAWSRRPLCPALTPGTRCD